MITSQQLRQKYLDFFASKGHTIIPSASLIPENDPTTLFTGSGMQPLLPFLLGEKHPSGTRLCDSQKCFRAEDVDDVGDNRHTTFFEMLGNWSLGDYFKQEQIPWIFEFLTQEIKLDPNRIYVSVFRGREDLGIPKDSEAVKLWQQEFKKLDIDAQDVDLAETNGMQNGRIFYYNEKKNWWSRTGGPETMPIGEPGGPDSEMFWDFGANQKLHESSPFKDQPCHPNCDCGRFMEIGNSVFMSYVKTETGFEELPKKNIDFGGGLERMTAAANDDPDMFNIDSLKNLQQIIEKLSGKKYNISFPLTKADMEEVSSMRVIMDHIRGVTFLISAGALPSNKDQGYFTRRFMRRAIRQAAKLGINQNFCGALAKEVINTYQSHYDELTTNRDIILSELEKEEDKFRQTLQEGLKELNKLIQIGEIEKIRPGGKIPILNRVDAKKAFYVYQSFGFPLEMIQEELASRALCVDEEEFQQEFKKHQDLSRTAAAGKFKGGLGEQSETATKYHTATHLLHQALRQVLGPHVEQRGSNITDERMRFDFSHPQKLTPEQIKEVEDIVNQQIKASLPIVCEEMSVDNAKSQGAIGLFGSKYGDKVKVYTAGEFSKEICGGPHVDNTNTLGHFKILKEESSSSGIRRIKAILE